MCANIACMLPKEIDAAIASCFFLQDLTLAERFQVIEEGRTRQVPRGEFFFHQGEDAVNLYILTAGRCKLSQVTADGHQVIVNILGPGDELGIIVALSYMNYLLSAEAIEECTAIGWHRETMRGLMRRHPQLALNGIEMIGRRFGRLQRRFQEVATQRVEQRVARTLMRLTRRFGRREGQGIVLDMPITREDLAQMTGTNLYSVSRILSKWEQAGIITTSRKQIVLGKPHELVAIAEDLHQQSKPET